MRWLLSCTLAQLITLAAGFALHHLYGFPMPLNLLQIIWIHLLVNVVPLCCLGSDQIRERFRYRKSQTVPPFLQTFIHSDLLRGLLLGCCAIAGFLVTVGLQIRELGTNGGGCSNHCVYHSHFRAITLQLPMPPLCLGVASSKNSGKPPFTRCYPRVHGAACDDYLP